MRSLSEIRFRLRQEAANVYLLLRQPKYNGLAPKHLHLPDGRAVAEALRGSDFASSVEQTATQILQHLFPILGLEIETGVDIQWRRDYLHAKDSIPAYFKRIPYLNFESVGDHKLVWELNRHQHLVLLAQAFLFTGQTSYLAEIKRELKSWFEQNPFQRGINWASALEVAFRALSWIWVYHLVGAELELETRQSIVSGLYQHGLHLAENLSVYFSPNTHLLGEAVALFALSSLFPEFPQAGQWRSRSWRIVTEQLKAQVKDDGSHFEQSTYYHVYALDFFLFFYVVAGRPKEMEPALVKMAEYLSWLLGPSREIDFFGDDDGGRLFHPYGRRSCFGRATLATCGVLFDRAEWSGSEADLCEQAVWWLGSGSLQAAMPNVSGVTGCRVFRDAGTVFLQAGRFEFQMDCGPFGFGGAGHSHSDSLSCTLRLAGEPILVDPGTFTYISDVEQRNWFRGSGAHNTVRVDGRDQADSTSPFRWAGKPDVQLLHCGETEEGWLVEALCEYWGIRHKRKVLLNELRLLVLDEIRETEGNSVDGIHRCEQIWQLGPKADLLFLSTSMPSIDRPSSFSPAYGRRINGRSRVVVGEGPLPMSFAMILSVEQPEDASIQAVTSVFNRVNKKD